MLLTAAAVVSTVAGALGDWFAPVLVVRHPLLQITLNARLRYLTLVAGEIPAVLYYSVALLRTITADVVLFLIGLWWGDRAVRWVASHAPGADAVLVRLERWFTRFGIPLVILFPSGLVALFAGASGMGRVAFGAALAVAAVGRAVLGRVFAASLAQPIHAVIDWIGRYQWWLLGVTLVVGVGQWVRTAAKAKRERNGEAAVGPADESAEGARRPGE